MLAVPKGMRQLYGNFRRSAERTGFFMYLDLSTRSLQTEADLDNRLAMSDIPRSGTLGSPTDIEAISSEADLAAMDP